MRPVAIWRRPKLTARGDLDHDHVVAGIVARLMDLPRRAVVLAEDETHLNLLPHVRASWTLRGARPQIPTPGTNRQVTVLGVLGAVSAEPDQVTSFEVASVPTWLLYSCCARCYRWPSHGGHTIIVFKPAGTGCCGHV